MAKPPIPETRNRYAVCVGINQYSPSALLPQHLHYAEADAKLVYDLLRQHDFAEEHCCLLTGTEATTQAIEDALKTLLLTKARSDDLVIFYFAGHGVLIRQPDEEEEADAPCEVFLVPSDFDRDQVEHDRGAWLECPLRIGNLRSRFFEHTRSRKVLFLLDSCHSGDFYGPTYREGEAFADRYIGRAFATRSAGRVVLSSCLPQQEAYEDARLGHGRFTHYLLEALEGRATDSAGNDGWVTVSTLFDYLSDKLPEHQRPVESGVKQGKFQLLYYPHYVKQTTPMTSLPSEHERKREREERLKALLIDHSGFMRNRLESFVGRERELEDIRHQIKAMQPTGGYLTITGQAGQGKSSIIARLVQEYGPGTVAHHFIPFNPRPDHQISLLRDVMAQLILKHDLSDLYVASESRPALRDYFPKVLAEVVAKGKQEVIFIDGLDQLMEDANGERDLSFLPDNPPEGIVFVLGTRPNDTLHPLELRKPHVMYHLPNLSRPDFTLILQHRHVHLDRALADQFYKTIQENALYLDLVAKELSNNEAVKPEEIIQHVADDPENIFYLSTARLKRDKTVWSEVLKPLLGVLLVAREPLTVQHLRQILELDDERVREGLVRLGGLIADDGRHRYSLFHLKLYDYLRQDEARPHKEYIFAKDEVENWHKRLAEWCERGDIATIWEDIPCDSIEQGRREYARHHYLTHLYHAHEWQRLFAVLDKGAYGRAKLNFDPSTRLYAQDLDLGRQAAAWEGWTLREGIALLPQLWRYTLLRCSLTSRADRYPLKAFQLLLLLKRERQALGVAELLTRPDHKARVLLHIAKYLGEHPSRKPESVQMLMRACDVACRIEISWQRAGALQELGTALAQAQQWERAMVVWNKTEAVIGTIEDSWQRAGALRELGTALAQAHQWERATVVWNKTEAVIGTIEDSWERAWALQELGTALAQVQQWERAEAVIRTMEDSEQRARALQELGTALAQVQQWERAEVVIGMMEDSEQRAWALRELGTALAQAQQWDRATVVWNETETVIGTIEDSEQRARALRELGTALAQAHQWERAEVVIRTIEDSEQRAWVLSALGTALVQQRERARALRELGTALAQAQQSERATVVWNETETVIRTLEDSEQRAWALHELGIALVKAHQWERAEAVIRTIKDEDTRARTLLALGTALVQAHQWERAEAVIRTMEDSEQRAGALRELAEALTRSSEYEQLLRLVQHSWLQAGGRASSITLFPLAYELLSLNPEIGLAFCEAFSWVDTFLKG
jgi:tetratricopeptide (TPR) repeat protein